MKHPILLAISLALAGTPLSAAETADVRAALAERLSGVSVDDVRESAVPGLYEVMVGPRLVYVTADGRYLVQGTIMDLEDRANLTEPRRAAARAAWVAGMDESRMVVFEPEGESRHTVTVFTDIDCGYCRAMHAEIDELLTRGVRVRYLLFPRAGPGTGSAQKADHVWCSADRQQALTRAKLGEEVEAPDCETPVMETLMLGQQLPVTGTPMLLTETGEMIPGFVPPAQLVAELDRQAAATPQARDAATR